MVVSYNDPNAYTSGAGAPAAGGPTSGTYTPTTAGIAPGGVTTGTVAPATSTTAPTGVVAPNNTVNTATGTAGTPIGNTLINNPGLTWQQQADLFSMPNQPQQTAGINGAFNLAGGAAPQLAGSPLVGLTTLGNAATGALGGGQVQDINALNAMANGVGPSVAEQQAKMQGDRNVAQQMALIGSQRGASNPGLGLLEAQKQKAAADQQAVQAGVVGRTQEEMAARGQLTGALQGAQGQQLQQNQAQAQLNTQTQQQNQQVQQQTQMENLQTALQNKQISIQQYNAALQALMAESNNQLASNANYAGLVTGENTQLAGIQAGVSIADNANNMGLTGAGIAGGAAFGAGLLAASDRNLKTNIKSATRSMKDFLSKVGSSPASQFKLLETA